MPEGQLLKAVKFSGEVRRDLEKLLGHRCTEECSRLGEVVETRQWDDGTAWANVTGPECIIRDFEDIATELQDSSLKLVRADIVDALRAARSPGGFANEMESDDEWDSRPE